jgi:hypothetical protein
MCLVKYFMILISWIVDLVHENDWVKLTHLAMTLTLEIKLEHRVELPLLVVTSLFNLYVVHCIPF